MFYIEFLDKLNITCTRKLVVIGGFSGCYKTTLASNMVYNNALKLGYNCCFLSLEMDVDELLLRLLVIHAHHPKFAKYNVVIKIQNVYDNILTVEEKWFLFEIVAPDLKSSVGKIIIAGPEDYLELSTGLSVFMQKIEMKLSSLSEYHNLDLLVIDYIQLYARLFGSQAKDNSSQYHKLSMYVREMKYLTQTYNNNTGISIIALSQLNRASYSAIKERLKNKEINEEDKYKNIYDLTSISESSEIVNAADIVLTIYTDDKLKKMNRAIVQLSKNRFGKTEEEGANIIALPEISYIGDPKDESICREDMANYIHDLIAGKL
jgi:replicative DNA helicase